MTLRPTGPRVHAKVWTGRSTILLPWVSAWLAAAALFLTPTHSARAGQPAPGLYVGLYGGGNVVLTDWDLHDPPNAGPDYTPGSGALGGLRLGVTMVPWLGVELSTSALPYSSQAGGSNVALHYSGALVLTPFDLDWAPMLFLGGGAHHSVSGDHGADIDYSLSWGLGLRGMLTDWLGLRVDARHVLADGPELSFAHLVEASVGLDVFVWGSASGGGADRDGDGIPDAEDRCVLVEGVASAQGCPDRDGDGVTDAVDDCPRTAGADSAGGCPDADGDGVKDALDACKDQPGDPENQGCPASVKPPDGDGDGVPDTTDRCPKVAGTVKLKGCPDKDGDGVGDAQDKCPDTPGLVDQAGCVPPELAAFLDIPLTDITFRGKGRKLRLSKKGRARLDAIAPILQAYPALIVRIEVHVGTKKKAKTDKLLPRTQAQAELVRAYLVGAGVRADHLVAKGMGASKPIESNASKRGRKANRRVELHLVLP